MIGLVSLVVAGIIGLLITLFYIANKQENKRTYIYKGNKYYLKGSCMIKGPSGLWIDGVEYISFKTGKLYVREKNDFLVKFETYKQWKNGNRSR